MSAFNMSVFQDESAEAYHAKAKDFYSSHQFMDFMNWPDFHHRKRQGLVAELETRAQNIGTATHTLTCEGPEVYRERYAIGGPINPATGKPFGNTTKKFQEWQEAQQKPVLTFEQAELVETMNAAVQRNQYAVELLKTGRAEGVVRTEYCGLPCQIRIDWFNPDYGIIDLKTCDDLNWFESDARRFRYHNQMAFYQCVLDAAIGQLLPVYLIAVEKKEPFRCGVWQVTSETLLMARAENEAAIERLKQCRATDCWPTGYEEMRMLSIV